MIKQAQLIKRMRLFSDTLKMELILYTFTVLCYMIHLNHSTLEVANAVVLHTGDKMDEDLITSNNKRIEHINRDTFSHFSFFLKIINICNPSINTIINQLR